MKTNEGTSMVLPLSAVSEGEDHELMPGEFAGIYQLGFEAGYRSGREAGYEEGFREGGTLVHSGPSNGVAMNSVLESKRAPKNGPRRMLVGMPCIRCKVYLVSGETHCPCCKQPAER